MTEHPDVLLNPLRHHHVHHCGPRNPVHCIYRVMVIWTNFLPPFASVVTRIDPNDLKLPGRLITLGSGAFGTVYLKVFNGTLVAVKYIGGPVDDRLPVLREARAMGLLSGHPSFPFFFGLVDNGHYRGLVMEFIGNFLTG